MIFNRDVLQRYVEEAPLALAIERTLEAALFEKRQFVRPILDIGCGDGIFTALTFAEKIELGIDLDPNEIEKARRYAAYHELLVCPGDQIPRPDGSFATIFSNSVLEHIPDLLPVLREARRLLKRGGRFYVTVPLRQFERWSVIARLLVAFGLPTGADRYCAWYNKFWKHYNVHDVAGWQTICESAGFRVLAVQPYAPAPICTLNDLLVPPALPCLFSKKLFGRWIAIPALRRIYAGALHRMARHLIDRFQSHPGGGLVLLELTC